MEAAADCESEEDVADQNASLLFPEEKNAEITGLDT
jgi:hypothetical protein